MLGKFEIHEPTSVEDASLLLARYGHEAVVYAGGTELLLVMKEGLAHYSHLVNIKTIPNLDRIELSQDRAALRIGPLVTHRQLELSPLVLERAPLLADVESKVANIRVRVAGTIGGNLCFAEPHSDPAALLLAWGATLELAGTDSHRQIPVEDFFVGFFTTARQHEELLTSIQLPLFPPSVGGAYEKFKLHERPTAGVAARVQLRDGVIADARLVTGSVEPLPRRMADAEALLHDEQPTDAAFAAAAADAARAVDPIDDLYGSSDYKRNLVRVLTLRALQAASARAAKHALRN